MPLQGIWGNSTQKARPLQMPVLPGPCVAPTPQCRLSNPRPQVHWKINITDAANLAAVKLVYGNPDVTSEEGEAVQVAQGRTSTCVLPAGGPCRPLCAQGACGAAFLQGCSAQRAYACQHCFLLPSPVLQS